MALKILSQQLDPTGALSTRPQSYAILSSANSALIAPHVPAPHVQHHHLSHHQHQQHGHHSSSHSTSMSASGGGVRPAKPPLPVFLLPRASSCDLPGGLNYFCSRLPTPPAEAMSYLTNPQTMVDSSSSVRTPPRNRNCVLKVTW